MMFAFLWQQLQLLPSLSALQLQLFPMTAEYITPLSNLQHLKRFTLESTRLPSYTGGRALLAALQHLTQLQHLVLRECGLDAAEADPQQQGDSNQCFSTLTASTQLTYLALTDSSGRVLPQAAISHMSPAGRMLEDFKVLGLDSTHHWGQPCVAAAQVAMIAASCPALQQLRLLGVTPMGFDSSCLEQLPSGVTRVDGLGWVRPAP